jgi:hypothetical protein
MQKRKKKIRKKTRMTEINNKTKRVSAVDRCRGLALFLMLFCGAAKMTSCAPYLVPLSTHIAADAYCVLPHYCFYDFIAAMFVFTVGLGFGMSYSSAEAKHGTRRACKSIAKRALKIVGIGSMLTFSADGPAGIIFISFGAAAIIALIARFFVVKKHPDAKMIFAKIFDVGLTVLGIAFIANAVTENALYLSGFAVSDGNWGVLPSIGVAMLICLPLVKLKPQYAIPAVVAYSVLYALSQYFLGETAFAFFTHGGLLGAFGWALLLMLAKVTFDIFNMSKPLAFLFFAAVTLSALVAFSLCLPSKFAVNETYILVSYALCFIVFIIFSLFEKIKFSVDPLIDAGRNSLFIYVLHPFTTFVVGICVNAMDEYLKLPAVPSTLMAAGGLIGYFLIMCLFMRALNARGVRLKV